MEIRNIYHHVEFELLELNEYIARPHRNTFFEMIFVLEGEGVQFVNDHHLPYSKDKLFLIFPNDRHGFEVKQPSQFFIIRLNDSYLQTQSREWVQKVEYIFHNHNHLPGCILQNITDKPLIRSLVEAIIRENSHPYNNQLEVTTQLMNTIITIAARNIISTEGAATPNKPTHDALSLLNYIHRHIYLPDKLGIENMAGHFNFSANYISEYFKRQTGESIQQYIMKYRLRLIETRLLYTSQRLGEIALEFGFTDQSHMNRIFKKYKGMSPTEYRKNKASYIQD